MTTPSTSTSPSPSPPSSLASPPPSPPWVGAREERGVGGANHLTTPSSSTSPSPSPPWAGAREEGGGGANHLRTINSLSHPAHSLMLTGRAPIRWNTSSTFSANHNQSPELFYQLQILLQWVTNEGLEPMQCLDQFSYHQTIKDLMSKKMFR